MADIGVLAYGRFFQFHKITNLAKVAYDISVAHMSKGTYPGTFTDCGVVDVGGDHTCTRPDLNRSCNHGLGSNLAKAAYLYLAGNVTARHDYRLCPDLYLRCYPCISWVDNRHARLQCQFFDSNVAQEANRLSQFQ